VTYFGLVFIYFGGQGHSGGSDDDRGPAAAAANRRRSKPTTLTMLTTTLPPSINGSRTPDTDELVFRTALRAEVLEPNACRATGPVSRCGLRRCVARQRRIELKFAAM